MILIIPALELSLGKCIRCIEGEPGTEGLYQFYSLTPPELLSLWRRENAKCVYITDRDSLEGRNASLNERTILELSGSVDIPLTLLAGFATEERCRFWLDRGIYQIVIGKLARTHPQSVKALIDEYTSSRVVFGILARDRRVIGHTDLETLEDIEFAHIVRSLGGTRIVYTDITWEGKLTGPNIETLRDFARSSGVKVTAAGGIANYEQLRQVQDLEPEGVDSAVIGRALYENRFPCQRIWRIAEAQIEPQVLHKKRADMPAKDH